MGGRSAGGGGGGGGDGGGVAGAVHTSCNQAENSRLPQTDLIIVESDQLFY